MADKSLTDEEKQKQIGEYMLPLEAKLNFLKTEKNNTSSEEMKEKIAEINNKYLIFRSLASDAISKHSISVSKKEMGDLSDVKAKFSVEHSYGNTYSISDNGYLIKNFSKITDNNYANLKKVSNDDIFKSVEFNLEGSYKKVKDLLVKAELMVKYNHGNTEFKLLGEKDPEKLTKSVIIDKYKLTTEYKNVGLVAFVNHFGNTGNYEENLLGHADLKKDFVEYGIELNGKYIPLDNLTLTSKTIIAGQTKIKQSKTKKIKLYWSDEFVNSLAHTDVYVKENLGIKYDYKATDKLTVSPSLNLVFEAKHISEKYINKGNEINKDYKKELTADLSLDIAPKLFAEYKVSDDLLIGAYAEAIVNFKGVNELLYNKTNIKTGINLKYTW